ncbi:MAG: NAD(P)H-hydrate dehydratase [Thermodesulfobacteriota bacterium]|nr:NAD(P)H-hydrate dehydratase [Thermodesulfobacteriota bacterium]
MLAVVGTIPEIGFPLLEGKVTLINDRICIQGRQVTVNRGTPALMAAAIRVGEVFDQPGPVGYVAGDIGVGDGSRLLYEHVRRCLGMSDATTLTFHYTLPDVDWHNRILFAVEEMTPRPILIADAGFMYAAKMSGQAAAYDLFTPDVGELAFLADEAAPHPFYTRGFILHEENQVPDLVARAYAHDNASRFLLVKGKKDYVADVHGIKTTVDSPMEEALEAIGGTGDTLTGIVSALIDSGLDVEEAAMLAAEANRLAGSYARPTPATQVMEIVRHIPRAIEEVFQERRMPVCGVASGTHIANRRNFV